MLLLTKNFFRFSEKYLPNKLYNIRFKFQNYTLRCSHYSITLIDTFKLTPIFFPTQTYYYSTPRER